MSSKDELKNRVDDLLYETISCDSCGQTWKILKEVPPVKGVRLYTTPPPELPAGSCSVCGKTWCVGCAKEHLDKAGRFTCADCRKPLTLVNTGLKKIVNDWALTNNVTSEPGKKKSLSPAEKLKTLETPVEAPIQKRGRPRKPASDL
jgi:transcription elongation factor Elf1